MRRLFEVIHRLRERGVSILYVSHHLDEVFELADRVTVLRDGVRKATVPVSELDHGGLVELMVGHRIDAVRVQRLDGRQHTRARGARPARSARSTGSTST